MQLLWLPGEGTPLIVSRNSLTTCWLPAVSQAMQWLHHSVAATLLVNSTLWCLPWSRDSWLATDSVVHTGTKVLLCVILALLLMQPTVKLDIHNVLLTHVIILTLSFPYNNLTLLLRFCPAFFWARLVSRWRRLGSGSVGCAGTHGRSLWWEVVCRYWENRRSSTRRSE